MCSIHVKDLNKSHLKIVQKRHKFVWRTVSRDDIYSSWHWGSSWPCGWDKERKHRDLSLHISKRNRWTLLIVRNWALSNASLTFTLFTDFVNTAFHRQNWELRQKKFIGEREGGFSCVAKWKDPQKEKQQLLLKKKNCMYLTLSKVPYIPPHQPHLQQLERSQQSSLM